MPKSSCSDQRVCSAVHDTIRWWDFIDGPSLAETQRHGRITGEVFTHFGRHYGVLRTLGRSECRSEVLELLNHALNEAADAPLVKRAERLTEWSKHFVERRFTPGRPISALTKFSWLRYPQEWTMYDSLASRALRREGDPLRFYSDLNQAGFLECVTKLRAVFPHPERLIDFFLMAQVSAALPYQIVTDEMREWVHHVKEPLEDFLDRLKSLKRSKVNGTIFLKGWTELERSGA